MKNPRHPQGYRGFLMMEATPGFEPGVMVLQTIALPLGYVAEIGLLTLSEGLVSVKPFHAKCWSQATVCAGLCLLPEQAMPYVFREAMVFCPCRRVRRDENVCRYRSDAVPHRPCNQRKSPVALGQTGLSRGVWRRERDSRTKLIISQKLITDNALQYLKIVIRNFGEHLGNVRAFFSPSR